MQVIAVDEGGGPAILELTPEPVTNSGREGQLMTRVNAELKRVVPRLTHLRERSAALAAHRQQPTQVEMPKQGHGANRKRPAELAALIATFVDGLDQESA